MDNNDVQLIGGPCGQHGPYTFYKAFKYTKNGVKRVVTLSEFFFVKLWIDSDLLCIGELQLLWIDKNSEQVLASLRLYFLPENTPEGRMDHGEDEVLAIAEKVVIRVEDLISWITVDTEWSWGRLANCETDVKPPKIIEEDTLKPVSLTESSLDFSDVEKERKLLDSTNPEECGPSVVILSYPKYCRYRAMMKRLENVENEYLKFKIVNALGGFSVISKNTRILFCRDTFDYPELEGHELLCNHLAPKLKGRPRGKRKKRSVSPGSESNESESSASTSTKQKTTDGLTEMSLAAKRSTRSDNNESKIFIKELNTFMKCNHTPIGRIPSLGYKELDLHDFFTKVQKLGGYDCVTTNRLWKSIFDDMSGHQNSTSAATVIRRHYERFLLPYERHIKGEEYKPLPVSERRRLKSKAGSSASDNENSEGPSTSNSSSLQSSDLAVPGTSKESDPVVVKAEVKTSSLRSVRVKTERQKEKVNLQNNNNINDNFNEIEPVKKEDPDEKPKLEKLIIKSEAEECMVVKTESVKCEEVKIEAVVKIETVEKSVEPVTTAVAPIAQKVLPEKTLSPIEGKENVPFIKTGDAVVEVPFKPKTPEIVDLESDTFKAMNTSSINKTYVQEVKKRKLDILKEGGLEVTPVRGNSSLTITRDVRPSVIQPTTSMPPPSINIVPSKRFTPAPPASNITQSKPHNQKIKSASPTKSFPFVNGSPPPKVVQSRSIYSYSEKTVYGNPKDVLLPPAPAMLSPAHTPKFVGSQPRHNGGDILDLTVTSPQKPVVEMMRVPYVPSNSSAFSRLSDTKQKSAPVIDGRRLGSNLEITLVGPNNKQTISNSNNINHKYNIPPSVQISPQPSARYQHHQPHKRYSNDMYYNSKMPRTDDLKYAPKNNTTFLPIRDPKTGLEISLPSPYVNKSPSIKADPINNHMKPMQPPKSFPSPTIPPFPNYLSQVYESTKHLYPYSAMLDPYMSTFQNMYAANTPVNPQQMLLPTPEQLKLYAELLSTSRLPFTFPVPQDTNPNFKKP